MSEILYIQGIDRNRWQVEVSPNQAQGCTWERLEPCDAFEPADAMLSPRHEDWWPGFPLRRKCNHAVLYEGKCAFCGEEDPEQ